MTQSPLSLAVPVFINDTVLHERLAQISLLLLDVDGVLTDGRLFFNNAGDEFKAFNTLDGQGIKALQKSGVKVGIITGRTSELVARRARDLGIEILIQGREDKWVALGEILQEHPTPLHEVAFVGDDWPDLSVMTKVGCAIAPANAHESVMEHSHAQTQRKGGEGAVREVCDAIMKAKGTFTQALAPYIAS